MDGVHDNILREARTSIVSKIRNRATSGRQFARLALVVIFAIGASTISYLFSSSATITTQAVAPEIVWQLILKFGAKIGAVFLTVYMAQIFVTFARYNFRLADHLDAVADAVEFYYADSSMLNAMLQALSPRHITYGKEPSTPVQEIANLLREIKRLEKDSGKND